MACTKDFLVKTDRLMDLWTQVPMRALRLLLHYRIVMGLRQYSLGLADYILEMVQIHAFRFDSSGYILVLPMERLS